MRSSMFSLVSAGAILFCALGFGACSNQQNLGNNPTPAGGDAGGADAGPLGLRVFVTYESYSGNLAQAGGKADGLEAADALCQNAADGAGLGSRFVAYLSGGSVNAADRIADDGPFYMTDGKTLAYKTKAGLAGAAESELLSQSGKKPFTVITGQDKWGDPSAVSGIAWFWTGSASGGRATGRDCGRWTSDSLMDDGSQGSYLGLDGTPLACNNEFHLLCVEQRAPATPAVKKRVFVTSKEFTGKFVALGSPFTAVDLLCDSAAKDAGLGGEWTAWLSGRDGSNNLVRATDRVKDANYTLVDGTLAFDGPVGAGPLVPISMNEYGAQVRQSKVWTGTLAGGAPSTNYTCANWSDDSSNGIVGYTDTGSSTATLAEAWTGPASDDFGTGSVGCRELARLYCFER